MGTVWMIASGKGGVGKSTVTACLGRALAQENRKVCIVDGDVGLRDQDVLLGLEDRIVFDLLDVTEGRCRLEQALITPENEPKLHLLPANQFARAKEIKPRAFEKLLKSLKIRFDVILIDCAAGIERSLRGLMNAAIDETVLICTPDDVCIRNAERTAALMEQKELPRPRVIVNRLDEALIRGGEMYAAQVVADTLDLQLLGEIPNDAFIYRSMVLHMSPMDIECESRKCFIRIARRMLDIDEPFPHYGTQKRSWFRSLFDPTLKEVKRIDRK